MIAGDVQQLCEGLDVGLRSLDETKRLDDDCSIVGPKDSFGSNNDPGRVALAAALAAGWQRIPYGRRSAVLCPTCVAFGTRIGRIAHGKITPFRGEEVDRG